jgi:hypothetical protein
MKPKLNCPAAVATTALAPRAKRFTPALSPEKQARQALLAPVPGSPSRVPVLPQNRAYLKALREAELAFWDTPAANHPTPARIDSVHRLPSPVRERREGWLYALLAGLCLSLLGYEIWTAFQTAGNWQNFVRYVRQLLA